MRAIATARRQGEKRLVTVADDAGLPLAQVRLAVDFYAASPEEIDERIEAHLAAHLDRWAHLHPDPYPGLHWP